MVGNVPSLEKAVRLVEVGDRSRTPVDGAPRVEDFAAWLERDEAVDPLAEAPMDELLEAIVDAEGNSLHVWPIAKETEPFSAAEQVCCMCKNDFSIKTVSLLQVHIHKRN